MAKVETVHIGVLSDTHMPYRLPELPSSVVEVFADARVDLILHAGDVDDPRFLSPLSCLAPVIAVQGNVHPQDLSRGGADLPFHVEVAVCGRRLIVTHGHRRGLMAFWGKVAVVMALQVGLLTRDRVNRHLVRRLYRGFPWADVVVFGHTHKPFQGWVESTFFFNPGAVLGGDNQPPSVGLLTLGCGRLEAKVVPLPLEEKPSC